MRACALVCSATPRPHANQTTLGTPAGLRLEGAREREAPQRPDEQKAEAKYHGHTTQNGGMTGRRASKERDGGTEGRMEGWREG